LSETDSRPSEDHIRRAHKLVAILLPALREVARRHGYALAVHGSLERDIDLLAVPWRDGAFDADTLARAIHAACEAVMGCAVGPAGWTASAKWEPPPGSLPNPAHKPHGRRAWSIHLGGGPYLDLSIMPRCEDVVAAAGAERLVDDWARSG